MMNYERIRSKRWFFGGSVFLLFFLFACFKQTDEDVRTRARAHTHTHHFLYLLLSKKNKGNKVCVTKYLNVVAVKRDNLLLKVERARHDAADSHRGHVHDGPATTVEYSARKLVLTYLLLSVSFLNLAVLVVNLAF